MQKIPKIVILGAGFGGLYTYLNLRKLLKPNEANVILVNDTNYFLFTPLLHEVATGGLNTQHVIESIRHTLRNNNGDDLWLARVESVHTQECIVYTTEGKLPYDYLVVALGAPTNFYGVKGAEQYSLKLDNLGDAYQLRNALIDAFEKASKIQDPEELKKFLTFAVIGGGPTGVELAAEMAQLCFETFETYYKNIYCPQETTIYLIQRDKELLPQFTPWIRKYTQRVLLQKEIRILLESIVTEVTPEGIFLTGGKFIAAPHVIWVAGVAPKLCPFTPAASCDTSGRVHVNQFLLIRPEGTSPKDNLHIFALGDNAHVTDAQGKSLPMLAQVAVRQAPTVAHNIVALIRNKPLKKFHYRSQGSLISLGQWHAAGGLLGFIKVKGPLAWFIWRTVYLFKFPSWGKRLKIALDWTVNLFYPRDIASLREVSRRETKLK